MPFPPLDRRRVEHRPLAQRQNRVKIERDCVRPGDEPRRMPREQLARVHETADRMLQARRDGRPVILAFGAHAIKNGLAPVLIHLMENGRVTHLATNGAGIIHDWEFAYQGESSEDVRANVATGEFGNWHETGLYINLALAVGAYRGLGYGESVGRMIEQEGLDLPTGDELAEALGRAAGAPSGADRAGAAADLMEVMDRCELEPGRIEVRHPFRHYSAQAAACRLGIPFTGHPMLGQDIIYNHPANHGGAVGRTGLRDFLTFARSVSDLRGGVYLSVGSAVMSPMIFEKSFSMAQNLALQQGAPIEDHFIAVVDLAGSTWNWDRGEPPPDDPQYYLRFYKTFHRMGGTLRCITGHNRDFFLHLVRRLAKS